jgi:hypothetical protein
MRGLLKATAVTRHVRLVGWPAGAEEEPASIMEIGGYGSLFR